MEKHRTKRPTIIDVARKAGISKSTVSLVLQQSPNVKKGTQEKVLKAIQDTGYLYNRGAANMRGSNAGLVGLIINNLRNPYYTELAASTQMTFSHRGFATVIADTNEDPELEARVVGSMLEHGVDALLMAPTYGSDGKAFDEIQRAGIPMMQVLRKGDDRTDLFPHFSMDYKHGSHLAAEHLVEQGRSSLAFIGGVESREITIERMSGFKAVNKKYGLSAQTFLGDVSRGFGYQTALDIANSFQEIDAIMTFNDVVRDGRAFRVLPQPMYKLVKKIKLIGFDDIEESRYTFPTLSSIHCDVGSFWSHNRTYFDRLARNRRAAPLLKRGFPVQLVVRESSK